MNCSFTPEEMAEDEGAIACIRLMILTAMTVFMPRSTFNPDLMGEGIQHCLIITLVAIHDA